MSCEKCTGGFVIRTVDGKEYAFRCPDCEDSKSRSRDLAVAKTLPPRLRGCTFANFEPRSEALAKVARMMSENPDKSFWLYAGYGVGKSHLAAAWVNRRVELGLHPTAFFDGREFIDQLQDEYLGGEPSLMSRWFAKDSTVAAGIAWDECDASRATDFRLEAVFNAIHSGYNGERHAMVFTSNLTPSQMQQSDESGEPLMQLPKTVRRMLDWCHGRMFNFSSETRYSK